MQWFPGDGLSILGEGADVNLYIGQGGCGNICTCISPGNHMTDSCAGRLFGTHVC